MLSQSHKLQLHVYLDSGIGLLFGGDFQHVLYSIIQLNKLWFVRSYRFKSAHTDNEMFTWQT